MELEFLRQRSIQPRAGRCSLDAMRNERRAVAGWFVLGECKSDRRTTTPRLTFWRLRSVLDARDAHLEYLARAGIAGGPKRVIFTAVPKAWEHRVRQR